MKSQIAYFVGGLIISWAVWSTVDHLKCRPHDLTDSVPRDALALMQEYDAVLPWFRAAYSLKLGAFKIVKPADPRNASAFVTPLDDGYPRIYLFDNDTNGRPDSIMVQDSALHAIGVSDRDGDGKFDAHDFSTGMRSNSVSFIDGNMDGQFDLRLGRMMNTGSTAGERPPCVFLGLHFAGFVPARMANIVLKRWGRKR